MHKKVILYMYCMWFLDDTHVEHMSYSKGAAIHVPGRSDPAEPANREVTRLTIPWPQ